MSGVYFPKMQLPDKCKNCDLVFDLRASMYCPVSGELIDFEDTPETAKCPGIPVPDHGRLVDADALIDRHGDHIRAMSDGELAEFFTTLPCCPPGEDLEEMCFPNDSCEGTDLKVKRWLKWLGQEADNG